MAPSQFQKRCVAVVPIGGGRSVHLGSSTGKPALGCTMAGSPQLTGTVVSSAAVVPMAGSAIDLTIVKAGPSVFVKQVPS